MVRKIRLHPIEKEILRYLDGRGNRTYYKINYKGLESVNFAQLSKRFAQ